MNNRIICFLFLLSQNFLTNAQIQINSENLDGTLLSNIASGNAYMPNLINTLDEFKGSQYFIGDYCVGELLMSKSRHYSEGYLFRFDEYNNAVIVKNTGNGSEIEVNSAEVEGLKLTYKSKNYLFFKASLPDFSKETSRIVQLVFYGKKYLLYKYCQKKLYATGTETNTTERKTSEFKAFNSYYLKTETVDFLPIKLNKNMLLEEFASQKIKLNRILSKPEYKKINEDTVPRILAELEEETK